MNAVKLLSLTDDTARVGGYGVVFGGKDLEGETFTAETDFAIGYVPQPRVYYDHAMRELKHHLGGVVSIKADDTWRPRLVSTILVIEPARIKRYETNPTMLGIVRGARNAMLAV